MYMEAIQLSKKGVMMDIFSAIELCDLKFAVMENDTFFTSEELKSLTKSEPGENDFKSNTNKKDMQLAKLVRQETKCKPSTSKQIPLQFTLPF